MLGSAFAAEPGIAEIQGPSSYRPAPSKAESSEGQQPEASQPSESPQTDHHGAEQSPSVVKESPPLNAQPEAAQSAPQTNEESSPEWRSPEGVIAIFTVVLAVIAALQLIVFGLQARRLRQTVDAMKESERRQSGDTNRLITATNTSAAATEKAAEATNIATDAAKEANQLTTKLFMAEQRPWVSAPIIEVAAVRVEENGWRTFTLKFVLLNTGRAPAHMVSIHTKGFNITAGGYNIGKELTDLLKERVTSRKIPWPDFIMLFPNQPMELHPEVSIDPTNGAGGEKPKVIWPLVVGFVDYTYVLDGEHHQTSFGIRLSFIDGTPIPSDQTEILPDTLRVKNWPGVDFAS